MSEGDDGRASPPPGLAVNTGAIEGTAQNIIVSVRCRPYNEREKKKSMKPIVTMAGQRVELQNPSDPKAEPHRFTFDNAFDTRTPDDAAYAGQEYVYKCLGVPMLQHVFSGYNVCLFAYGQTGAGKTYSMMGPKDDPAITPRLCDDLFKGIEERTKKKSAEDGGSALDIDLDGGGARVEFKVECQYLEIYNEKVKCLLNPSKENLRVREHPSTGPYVDGITKLVVTCYDDIAKLLEEGNKARHVAATNMNDQSSRSHAIFTLNVTQTTHIGDSTTEKGSRINLVDLAGSERQSKTGATGDRLKEGAGINKSLTTLGLVIARLGEKETASSKKKLDPIPYRDSTLTWLLRENLGGNSRTFMLSAISPSAFNYDETLSTLRYADRAKAIVTKAVVNEDDNARLIRELREEIEAMRLKMLEGGSVQNSAQIIQDHQEAEALKEKLAESERLIAELNMSWEEKMKRSQEEQKDRLATLSKLGIIKVDRKVPYLVNLCEDPDMAEALLYYLNEGTTAVGNAECPHEDAVVLSGSEIGPTHCLLKNVENDVVVIPMSECVTFLNGAPVVDEVKLSHSDRLIIGQHAFRFANPDKAGATKSKMVIDLASAQKELDDYQAKMFSSHVGKDAAGLAAARPDTQANDNESPLSLTQQQIMEDRLKSIEDEVQKREEEMRAQIKAQLEEKYRAEMEAKIQEQMEARLKEMQVPESPRAQDHAQALAGNDTTLQSECEATAEAAERAKAEAEAAERAKAEAEAVERAKAEAEAAEKAKAEAEMLKQEREALAAEIKRQEQEKAEQIAQMQQKLEQLEEERQNAIEENRLEQEKLRQEAATRKQEEDLQAMQQAAEQQEILKKQEEERLLAMQEEMQRQQEESQRQQELRMQALQDELRQKEEDMQAQFQAKFEAELESKRRETEQTELEKEEQRLKAAAAAEEALREKVKAEMQAKFQSEMESKIKQTEAAVRQAEQEKLEKVLQQNIAAMAAASPDQSKSTPADTFEMVSGGVTPGPKPAVAKTPVRKKRTASIPPVGTVEIFKYSLVFVGHEEVGKTSMRKCLLREPGLFERKCLPVVASTVGMQMHEESVMVSGERLDFLMIDVAGQDCYHSHLFLLPELRALYLFVWKMTDPLDEYSIKKWLENIQSRSPGALMAIIGTHKDDLRDSSDRALRSMLQNVLQLFETFAEGICTEPSSRIRIIGNFAVSCKNRTVVREPRKGGPTKFKDLLQYLAGVAIQSCKSDTAFPRGCIPLTAISLAKCIQQLRKEGMWSISGAEYKHLASTLHPSLKEEKNLAKITQLLDCWKVLVHFSNFSALQKHVFLDPHWVMTLISTIFSYMHYKQHGSRLLQPEDLNFDVAEVMQLDVCDDLPKGLMHVAVAVALFRQCLHKVGKQGRDVSLIFELLAKFDMIIPIIMPTPHQPHTILPAFNYSNPATVCWDSAPADAAPAVDKDAKLKSMIALNQIGYLVPCIFNSRLPDAVPIQMTPLLSGFSRKYTFNVMPRNLFPRLICRLALMCHRIYVGDIHMSDEYKPEYNNMWRNGCWVQDRNSIRALVRVDRRSIFLNINSSSLDISHPSCLFRGSFHNILSSLAAEYPGLHMNEFAPCVNLECEYWLSIGAGKDTGTGTHGSADCPRCSISTPMSTLLCSAMPNSYESRKAHLERLLDHPELHDDHKADLTAIILAGYCGETPPPLDKECGLLDQIFSVVMQLPNSVSDCASPEPL